MVLSRASCRLPQQKKKNQPLVQGVTGKMANLWADIYELTKLKQPNSYRMASRQACNFTFPEGIVRPRPRDMNDIEAEIANDKEDIIDADLMDVVGPAEQDADKLAAAAEDAAIDEGTKAEAIEEAKAAGNEEEAEEIQQEGEALLIAETPPVP